MPTVSQGASATVDIAIGQKLSVSTTGEAYVDIVAGPIGAGYTSKRVLNGAMTFGPYGVAAKVRVRAVSGTATYEGASEIVPAQMLIGPSGNVTGLVAPDGKAISLGPRSAAGDAILTKYGVTAFDICRAPGVGNTMLIGTTDIASHAPSNERPRFSTYTRKVVLGATGNSQMRFVQMNAFDPDPVEKAFSVSIYLESVPNEFAGAGLTPYVDVELSASSTTNAGSNYSRWSFNSASLRQGWNVLKLRQADTVSSTPGAGNLPVGVTHPADIGTGFDWNAGQARYLSLRFTNMAGQTVHIDQIRKPAKAKPILVLGFDANGASLNDSIFVSKVAPLLAKYNMRSYVTLTNIYEMIYSGSTAWKRIASLYNNYGWDVINHTWSHGGTEVGRNTTLASLAANADVVTATFASAHGITLGNTFRAKISGASIGAANGVFEMVANTATTATYTAAGAGTATATGTILLCTFLSEVFGTDTAENRRLWKHEVADISQTMRSVGFARAAGFLAYPNNSAPELNVLQYGCNEAGIKIGRGYRNGYTVVNEFGIDNPLHCGSFEMGSGATATQTSTLEAKIAGAIARGEHIQIYGHFILDDTDPANASYAPLQANGDEYPPGSNGNPNPPAAGATGVGGWWYFSQLKRLIDGTVGPAVQRGDLLVMSPSEYLAFMGY